MPVFAWHKSDRTLQDRDLIRLALPRQRLVSMHKLGQDLFAAADELAELAYKRQVQASSYRKTSES